MANYKVNGNVIVADIERLTDKEMKTLSKYVALGFTIEPKTKVKKERMKEKFILDYLKDDEEAIKTYKEIYNKTAVDEDGNPKMTSKGNEIKQGFNAGRFWFCKTYPINLADVKKEIEENGRTEELNEAYNDYKKAKDNENKNKTKAEKEKNKPMSEEEYTRVFYWKHIKNM